MRIYVFNSICVFFLYYSSSSYYYLKIIAQIYVDIKSDIGLMFFKMSFF